MSKKRTSRRVASAPSAAPYAHTDDSETSAIACFKFLLDPSVKAHIAERDKRPNVDGFLELCDRRRVPVGEVAVQVKHLDAANRSRLGYSCELALLRYCQTAPLPVLLIGARKETREAFWVEMTRGLAQRLLAKAKAKQQQSITVTFPARNAIHDARCRYLAAWRTIARDHVQRIVVFDKMAPEVRRLRKIEKSIQRVGIGFPDDDGLDFSSMQEHLDELNRLLHGEFGIVGRTLFSGAWKVGCAFVDYTTSSLAYCYYPVRKGNNDLLMRRVSSSVFQGLDLTTTGYPFENPIADDPIGFARSFVREQALKILDAKAIVFDDLVLARELLFAVADKLGTQLGFKAGRTLDLTAMQLAWRTYLPTWVNYVLRTTPKPSLTGLFSSADGYLDLDYLKACVYSFAGRKRADVDKAVKGEIAKGRRVVVPFPIGVKELPLGHVDRLLTLLLSRGTRKIQRLYSPFNYHRRSGPGLISDWWSHRQLVTNLKRFYALLPAAVEHVVKLNFPGLEADLNYFKDVDRRIIVVDESNFGPWLRYSDLVGDGVKRIEVHSWKDEVRLPEGGAAEIDGVRYDVPRWGATSGMFMFHPLPLLNEVVKQISERLRNTRAFDRISKSRPAHAEVGSDGDLTVSAPREGQRDPPYGSTPP